MKKSIAFLSSVLLIVFCFSAIIFAQETTGEIQGTTKDATGAVVPNVTINIRGVDVGFTRSITTDAEGYYRARQIPPGIYNLETVASSGFAVQTRNNVQVVLGQAATIDFELGTTVGATVDVTADTGSETVDTTDSKVQESITAREIDVLPKGTSFSSLLRTTTAVRPEPLSGQFSINGATGPENSFVVDGQEVNNFRTGVLNGNNDIPYQSVQEVQVKSSGFEAEFGGATGGVINVATKSGTNQFRGEFGTQFGTQRLNAGPRSVLTNTFVGVTAGSIGRDQQFTEYLQQNRDSGTDFFPTASLGGPIIKDKFWFYGIYSPRIFNTTRTTNFVQGFDGYTPRNAAGVQTGYAGRVPTNFCNPSLITATPNTPLCRVGAETTQTATAKQTNEYGFIKLDATPTNTLRISSSFTYNPIVQEGLLLGGTTVIGSPNQGNFGSVGYLQGADLAARQGGRQNSNNFRIEGNYTPNSKLVTTLRYTRGFLNEKLGSYFIPQEPRFRCRSAATPAIQALSGCPSNGYQSTLNNFQTAVDASVRTTVDADASYLLSNFGGRHEFKGGYQFNRISNVVDAGYRDQGVVNLYYNQPNVNLLNCGGFAVPNPVANQPANSIGSGCIVRFGTRGEASNRNQAIYVQDKWQPINRLTFNLGVRIEQEDLPAFNGEETNLKFSFKDKFAPRIGVAYDLTGDGKTKVSAFFGRFYDRLKFELPRGSFGGDFYRVDFFNITADNPRFDFYTIQNVIGNFNDPIGGSCAPGGIPVASGRRTRCQVDYRVPSNLPNLVLSSGAPLQPGAVDPDLRPFRQTEVNVEFQREVLRSSVIKARYLFRNVDDAVEDAGFLTPDGSEFYIIANPGKGLHAQRARELGFQRLVEPQRRYDALQIEYDSRFVENLSLNVNYVFSRLYGNYSGLANSDEGGRLSPGVNRLFDLPFVGFTAAGNPDNGRLPLDRPHVFKASGTYTFDNYFGNKAHSTDLSFFTTVQSGTPQTTFTDIFGIPIPLTVRGDLGRTERFTQTDLNLQHRYRFGADERFAIVADFNVINVFNENNVLGISTTQENASLYLLDASEVAPATSTNVFRDAVNILTSRGVLNELRASQGTLQTNPENFNEAFQLPNLFQAPRSVRFGFRFIF